MRSTDNVDSCIQPGRNTSWSSVVGHMWRVYDTVTREWLGAVEVDLPAPPLPQALIHVDDMQRRVMASGMQPLPPPVGKLAKSCDEGGHQLFYIT